MFAFGMKMTADREMVKDCIHDVFVKLYTRRGELGAVLNMESYLYVSLKNRIKDEFRYNSHILDCELDETTLQNLYDNDDTYYLERIEDELRTSQRISEFVKFLSPRQQEIIRLFYMEQRKYDEICQIMGINYQSVRNLMHRSLLRLRQLAARNNMI